MVTKVKDEIEDCNKIAHWYHTWLEAGDKIWQKASSYNNYMKSTDHQADGIACAAS
jgi:hypothetical protein